MTVGTYCNTPLHGGFEKRSIWRVSESDRDSAGRGKRVELATARGILKEILAGNLDFHGDNSTYASHALHAFAAKFPPQLPRVFIKSLTEPGDLVLDPMMGSGTAILEAVLLGRRAVGVDIDPLAMSLCRAKITPIETNQVLNAAGLVLDRARALLNARLALRGEIEKRYDPATVDFLNYWFLPETQEELMALLLGIEEQKEKNVHELLRVIFSSVIITKSGGVSLARDLAHTRPHRVSTKRPRSAIEQFNVQVRKATDALGKFALDRPQVELYCRDARDLPLADCSVDLVVTSPPYANAIDYMRAHKFSLVWFGQSVKKLSELRAVYVGSENCKEIVECPLPFGAKTDIAALCAKDRHKARVLQKYLGDMKMVLTEIHRVLRPGCVAGIVVGPSTMRGVKIQTHKHLAEIATQLGFDVVGIGERKLDRNRRMMPAHHGKCSMNGIELRVHEEFVIGLVKA